MRCEALEGEGAPWAAQRSGRAARSKARASCAGGGAGRPETAAARTGRRGEDAAAEWLRGAGFELLDRNWRSGRYELDIVALRGGELHFAEVKTRRAEGLTPPEQAATPAKQRAMMRAAAAYVRAHPMEVCDFRFDLLAVDAAADGTVVVRFVPDAFEPHW
ncbi:YraN family protein [uncultured Alistipes sp.]|uniref:YraN family protein n=1 Tax=uncultured Alistipes sp. TaxID=538949 RepID=UPI0034288EE0